LLKAAVAVGSGLNEIALNCVSTVFIRG